jgi:hypothetical protein
MKLVKEWKNKTNGIIVIQIVNYQTIWVRRHIKKTLNTGSQLSRPNRNFPNKTGFDDTQYPVR